MISKRFILLYFAMLPVFFLIDMVWLGLVARNIYFKYIGKLLLENFNLVAGIIFYLIFIVGILIFAVMPALEKNSFIHALIYGALFGFFCYATYDLTNLSTLKDWPLAITLIDMAWGCVLSGVVSSAGFLIGKYFIK